MIVIEVKGQRILLDNKNEHLSKLKWHITKTGYAARYAGLGRGHGVVYMHHDVLGIEKGLVVDHRNRNKLDNRVSNLRHVTQAVNSRNRGVAKGYTWASTKNKWRAYIKFDYKQIHLGYFTTESDARQAYLTARKLYF